MKKMKTLTVNGETFVVCDPEAARIDDSVVGEQAWSGKQILDRLCPPFAATGVPVTCRPVEGYPLQVVSADGENLIADTSYLDESQWDFQAGWTETAEECYVFPLGNSFASGTYSFSGHATHGVHLAFFHEYPACWVDEASVSGDFRVHCNVAFEEDFTENRLALIIVEAELGDRTLAEVIASLRDLKLQKGVVPTKIFRTGKNLFDFKQDMKLVNLAASGSSQRYGYELPLPPGTYTAHAEERSTALSPGTRYIYSRIRYADGTYSATTNVVVGDERYDRTYTLQDGDILLIYNGAQTSNPYGVEASTNQMFQQEYNLQIEAGDTATAYEPYKSIGEFAPGETVPALAGVNTLWADVGEITVTGRSDPVAILETLMGGAQDVSDSH